MDVPPARPARQAADRPRGPGACPAIGQGEPPLELRPDRGELRKLGLRASATTIRNLLRTARRGPAPRRGGPTWTRFLRAQAGAVVACDFFSVETGQLRTLYALVFIELGSRRIHCNPSTARPDSAWVTQQARNLVLALDGRPAHVRFLVRDRDTKFTRSVDEVFRSEGVRVFRTPVRAPNANAHAERVIETIRAERLDWSLVWGSRHLDRTLHAYAEHYNLRRPHRGIALAPPHRATCPRTSARLADLPQGAAFDA